MFVRGIPIRVNKYENEIYGYIIQNPLKNFVINLNKIVKKNELKISTLIPNKYYVKFHQNFL